MIIARFLLILYFFRNIYVMVLCCILAITFYITPYVVKNFYQNNYGEIVTIVDTSNETHLSITPITDKIKENYSVDKYTITYEPQAEIDLRARVAFIDYHDTFFSNKDSFYDAIFPVDLAVFIGSMAENWEDYKIKHEDRSFILYGPAKRTEWMSMPIIPANKTIYAGLKTIFRGDIISLKGYLINWEGTGKYKEFKSKTAIGFNTASNVKIGGTFTWRSMLLFITELEVDGYIYK